MEIQNTTVGVRDNAVYGAHPAHIHSHNAASWPAILAGAVAATAISIVLITLGSGLGFSVMSPYEGEGMSAKGIAISAVIWMIIVQWAASGIGGYMAGRLRNRWEGLHGDEVFFRDSAHGMAAWAVATIIAAGFLISSVSSVAQTGTQAASIVAAGKVSEEKLAMDSKEGPYDYYIDSLYRNARADTAATNADVHAQTNRIIMRGMESGTISDNDRAYLGQVVASRTGLSTSEANARVDSTLADIEAAKEKAKAAADEASKAAAKLAIFTALSMLIGAFIASVTGILGGRCRDEL